MSQEHLEAARTLGFEVRNPQRFAHNMARLVEETSRAGTFFVQPHAKNPPHLILHGNLAPPLGLSLRFNKLCCGSPARCSKPRSHSGAAASTYGTPSCAGSWGWRTGMRSPSASHCPKIPGLSTQLGQRTSILIF